jgi:hypothetical protein
MGHYTRVMFEQAALNRVGSKVAHDLNAAYARGCVDPWLDTLMNNPDADGWLGPWVRRGRRNYIPFGGFQPGPWPYQGAYGSHILLAEPNDAWSVYCFVKDDGLVAAFRDEVLPRMLLRDVVFYTWYECDEREGCTIVSPWPVGSWADARPSAEELRAAAELRWPE